jgi:DNA helicase-2/ATP-dependent DNA helicase PcrA
MAKYETEYKLLNAAQKRAVEATEGPQLVIAGPGTGKTQLLSMRVANILRKNDVQPANILCLTFTDNAARNMRERLSSIIGQPAYHVAIHTFHSFGTDIITNYPDYFTERQLLQQVDELGRYELLQAIFEELPHSNPLSAKVGEQFIFLKDALNSIGWLKQNAVAPVELHELLNANEKFIKLIEPEVAETFTSTPSPKQLDRYKKLLENIRKHVSGKGYSGFPEYAAECAAELEQAINETDPAGRFAKPITAWRNNWCKKDAENMHGLKDGGQNYRKMHALANVYQQLADDMTAQGLYDFDDMVTLAVHVMEQNDELRHNLQERYQYVLVDEFQDTNKAQLRMLNALGDNPVHEGRPNLMAVGDDDQAIYAFQGAEVSNMAQFERQYGAKPIILADNYRSNANILELAGQVSAQITNRLSDNKQLTPKKKQSLGALDRLSFGSELAQYAWIAEEVEQLIGKGARPEDIAIIAPRHRYLERLMPYLGEKHIPVAYERRENILDAPIILELLTMAELVLALSENRHNDADTLFGQVLGYDFWAVPPDALTQVSLDCYDKHKHWLEILSRHKDTRLREITGWFVGLAKRAKLEPMEYLLDQLIGSGEQESLSPLRAHYFSRENYEGGTETYLTLLGQLSTLRQRLRQWKPRQTLFIKDLMEFTSLHRAANLKIIDTNPHTQTTNVVQVMTAYKAKGLEFGTVFIINSQDEVWGPTARSGSSRISLPRNLPIQPAGESDNDKLRLLFVACTRAKHTLHITGYVHTLENKPSPPLSFLEGLLDIKSIDRPAPADAEEILSTDWVYRFRQVIADKPSLLEPILANYKLSVTHLNNFIDVQGGGPEYFLVHNLLRFPEALSPSAAYGDAVHKTLQWSHAELRSSGNLPTPSKVQDYFTDILSRKHLRAADYKKLEKRGQKALSEYFAQRGKYISVRDLVERGFNNEGVVVAGAHLSGKIDKLHFKDTGIVEVVDFKTGKPSRSWQGKDEFEKIKLHKYRQQLLFYKLLVERSASFSGRLSVSGGALEFVETDVNAKLIDNLELSFEPEELAQFERLIGAVWAHIMNLDFPNVSEYPRSLKGIQQFEQDLVEGRA